MDKDSLLTLSLTLTHTHTHTHTNTHTQSFPSEFPLLHNMQILGIILYILYVCIHLHMHCAS